MEITIRVLQASEVEPMLPQLITLLLGTVNQGNPLGFMPPITARQAELYWRLVRREVETGMRVLVVAARGDRLAGSGQLALAQSPNGRHRAELQKLLVSATERGLGIGRSLVETLHRAAVERRRSLLVLHTRRGQAAVGFYRTLGYREVGIIPGYSMDPDGQRIDDVTMYQELVPTPSSLSEWLSAASA